MYSQGKTSVSDLPLCKSKSRGDLNFSNITLISFFMLSMLSLSLFYLLHASLYSSYRLTEEMFAEKAHQVSLLEAELAEANSIRHTILHTLNALKSLQETMTPAEVESQ
mmetsp:Transcript_18719/g.25940  ORF Transcript_18719/g.25940 Transcript_18719/m.25940 type:complete len:109 (+) Transcript_18719:265-591(+)